MTSPDTALPVVQADLKLEYPLFSTWWNMWMPGQNIPPVTSHIFDAWVASARHSLAHQPDHERIAHILSEMGGAADWSHALAIADAIVGDAGG